MLISHFYQEEKHNEHLIRHPWWIISAKITAKSRELFSLKSCINDTSLGSKLDFEEYGKLYFLVIFLEAFNVSPSIFSWYAELILN